MLWEDFEVVLRLLYFGLQADANLGNWEASHIRCLEFWSAYGDQLLALQGPFKVIPDEPDLFELVHDEAVRRW